MNGMNMRKAQLKLPLAIKAIPAEHISTCTPWRNLSLNRAAPEGIHVDFCNSDLRMLNKSSKPAGSPYICFAIDLASKTIIATHSQARRPDTLVMESFCLVIRSKLKSPPVDVLLCVDHAVEINWNHIGLVLGLNIFYSVPHRHSARIVNELRNRVLAHSRVEPTR
jgi:hypothetical protein